MSTEDSSSRPKEMMERIIRLAESLLDDDRAEEVLTQREIAEALRQRLDTIRMIAYAELDRIFLAEKLPMPVVEAPKPKRLAPLCEGCNAPISPYRVYQEGERRLCAVCEMTAGQYRASHRSKDWG